MKKEETSSLTDLSIRGFRNHHCKTVKDPNLKSELDWGRHYNPNLTKFYIFKHKHKIS